MRSQLLLLVLRLRRRVAVRGVEGRGGGQGRVGLGGALTQTQAQVVVSALLDEELLQTAVGGDPRQEVLVGGKHAAELLVEAAGVRLAHQGDRGGARGVVGGRGRGGGGRGG